MPKILFTFSTIGSIVYFRQLSQDQNNLFNHKNALTPDCFIGK